MDVVIEYMPWTDDHRTRDDETANVLLIGRILFNGEEIPHEKAAMTWDGPLEGMALGHYDFTTITLHGVPEDVFAALSVDDYAMGSTAEECSIIVSSLRVEEVVPVA